MEWEPCRMNPSEPQRNPLGRRDWKNGLGQMHCFLQEVEKRFECIYPNPFFQGQRPKGFLWGSLGPILLGSYLISPCLGVEFAELLRSQTPQKAS